MPPTPDRPGSARSAAALNEEIRALLAQADGVLSAEQKRAYEDLVTRWAEAMRDEVVEAA